MSDEEINAIYMKAIGMHLDPVNLERARKFIKALFDALPIADTTPDFEPLYRRPD